jgi:hypothetical protein
MDTVGIIRVLSTMLLTSRHGHATALTPQRERQESDNIKGLTEN